MKVKNRKEKRTNRKEERKNGKNIKIRKNEKEKWKKKGMER